MKYLNTFLNTIIGAFIGTFIGYSVFQILDYKKYPDLYAMTSAPWYYSIILYGIVALIVIVIVLIIKKIIKQKNKF